MLLQYYKFSLETIRYHRILAINLASFFLQQKVKSYIQEPVIRNKIIVHYKWSNDLLIHLRAVDSSILLVDENIIFKLVSQISTYDNENVEVNENGNWDWNNKLIIQIQNL